MTAAVHGFYECAMSSPPAARVSRVSDHAEVRGRLLAAVRRVCPAWLADDADDIVQMAMMRLLDGRVQEVNSAYLNRLAYCATIDEIRRRRAMRTVASEELPEVKAENPSADPGRKADDRAVATAIRDCLAGLLDNRRAAVGLYLEGHTVPEVGRLLDTTPKNAENWVYRGLDDLRQCLLGKGVAP
ncbi:MAG: RNA polymerase sigma factor [Deltaproteobacteria bacterium]|nr:RNA polymerase sigma factor [Deltaproteobacteria bacterium]